MKSLIVSSGLILCLYRSLGPKENRAAFEGLKRFYRPENGLARPGVVGMDLAGDEARYPTIQYAEFFEEGARLGIPATCHAGETVGTANLEAALALGVRRIGHGTHLAEHEPLLRQVVERRIPIEIGLTSNLRTKAVAGLAEHPALRFHRAGVRISLNTDDRGLFGIDLTHEYGLAREAGFTLEELSAISVGAVDHLFLPAGDKRRLAASFSRETKALLEAQRAGRGTGGPATHPPVAAAASKAGPRRKRG